MTKMQVFQNLNEEEVTAMETDFVSTLNKCISIFGLDEVFTVIPKDARIEV
jgi:hypothetical protein